MLIIMLGIIVVAEDVFIIVLFERLRRLRKQLKNQ
jgi:hypothetical protein